MRKVFLTSMLVVLVCSALAGSGPAKASPDRQARQIGAEGAVVYLPVFVRFTVSVGTVYGKVIDGGDGLGIPNAQVCYGTHCATTLADGSYTLDGLPSGQLTFVVTASEYLELAEKVTVAGGQNVYHQFTLTKNFVYLTNVFIRIIVTWSAQKWITTPLGSWENDLDAYMWQDNGIMITQLYSGSPDGTNDCTAFPYMCLKLDARQGSGPETIDVSQLEVAQYYYGVFNVNQIQDPEYFPRLSQLEVIIRLYDDKGLQQTFYAPQGDGEFWYVFRMDENGLVTITNCLIGYPGANIPAC